MFDSPRVVRKRQVPQQENLTVEKAASDQFTAARMDQLMAGASEAFKADFLLLVTHLAQSVDVAEVEAAMRVGDIGQAIISTERLAIGLAGAWADAYQAGGDSAASFLEGELKLPVHFDLTNTRALDAVRTTQARLVREITEMQRSVLQDVLEEGIRLNLHPNEIARQLRQSLGLTQSQERAVRNYENLLRQGDPAALDRKLRDARFDPTVRRALSSDKPIPATDVDRMVERYRSRMLDFRAQTIARTEGNRAASMGVQAGFEQAAQRGDLPGEVQRTWQTRHDGRAREWHIEMHGQQRGLNEPFISGLGNPLMVPRDPSAPAEDSIRCRCRLSYRLK